MRTNRMYFRKLRALIFENDITQADIAQKIGKSKAYVSLRMQGKYDFNLGDIYAIIEILKIPPEKVLEYFPKDGVS